MMTSVAGWAAAAGPGLRAASFQSRPGPGEAPHSPLIGRKLYSEAVIGPKLTGPAHYTPCSPVSALLRPAAASLPPPGH